MTIYKNNKTMYGVINTMRNTILHSFAQIWPQTCNKGNNEKSQQNFKLPVLFGLEVKQSVTPSKGLPWIKTFVAVITHQSSQSASSQ